MNARSTSKRTLRLALAAGVGAAALAGGAGIAPPELRDLRLTVADARVTIGAVRSEGSFFSAAFAQSQGVTLENVSVETGFGTYKLPKVVFEGVSLSQADLAALFAATGPDAAVRLAKLDADRVSVPQLTIEQKTGEVVTRTTYRDVVATKIVGGRIGKLAAAGGAIESTEPKTKKAITTTYGAATISDFDLAHTARLYTEKAGATPEPLKPVYGAFSVDDIRMEDAEGVKFAVARVSGSNFAARPARETWTETMRLLGASEDFDKASPEQKTKLAATVADLFASFAVGTIEAVGVSIEDEKEDVTVGIARLAYASETGGKASEARLDGLKIAGDGAKIGIASITSTGFSIAPTLDGLREIAGKTGTELDPALARKLLPVLGTVRIAGIDADVEPEEGADNVRFGVKAVEITADQPFNGVPTNMRVGVENVTFAVPAESEDESLQQLAELGIKNLDLSMLLAAAWTADKQQIDIRELSVKGRDLGSVRLTGVLANVSKDAFDPDQAVATVALLAATAKSLTLSVDNDGLVEKLMAAQAKEQGVSPDEFRTQMAALATTMVPAMLGGSADAKALAQALGRFLAKPNELDVTVTAKDPSGLGVADAFSIDSPAAALEKVSIKAQAR